MSDALPQDEIFDTETYRDATDRLRRLKARLSENAVQVIAREVLTRVSSRRPANTHIPSIQELDRLTRALIGRDDQAGAVMVGELRESGMSVEEIYINHLSTVAAHLGELWNEDRISFMDVTLATSRIFGIMRAIGTQLSVRPALDQPSAIFAMVPGDEHTLGIKMATDLFRSEGWDITLLQSMDHDQLVERIDRADQVIIALSAGSETSLPALARLVVALRIHRPEVIIVLSGHIVDLPEDILATVAPDAIVHDVSEARDVLNGFLARFDD